LAKEDLDVTYILILSLTVLLILAALFFMREIQHARQIHELTDKLYARNLAELTQHQMATDRPIPKTVKVELPVGAQVEHAFDPDALAVSMVDAQAAAGSIMSL
jgi:hypothetical protein